MKIARIYTHDDCPVADQIEWKTVETLIDRKTGATAQIEVPAKWSQNAANILGDLYLRKAGVPSATIQVIPEKGNFALPPEWLYPGQPHPGTKTGMETSARQVFHRLAGAWTYHAWVEGYFAFDGKEKWVEASAYIQAQNFYDELYWCLAHQLAAPNSPQWFNTGLWWAYGIEGSDTGMWRVDPTAQRPDLVVTAERVESSYRYPQPHACFLTPTADDLVNEGGIMDTWVREARIFKHGSGSGINPSKWRGKGELLSGGGAASGMMSFLKIGDVTAGATQSGGNNRRAAKMVCVDDDHPEIEAFVEQKPIEEYKAAAMYVGSQVLKDTYNKIENYTYDYSNPEDPIDFTDIPQPMVDRLRNGFEPPILGCGWEGPAIKSIDAQNYNSSVWASDRFVEASRDKAGIPWPLKARTTGQTLKVVPANGLWDKICRAAWACADPGLLFSDTGNAWNTCAADGRIRTVNPCAEFWHLDGSACNLASLNLVGFLNADGTIDLDAYEHVLRLFTIVLDVSVSMAAFPAKEFAIGAYNYRTLGLGYANLGGLLMRLGLPYDSDEGRGIAAALTALMTGVAYRTSAELAEEVGPFPRWEANANDMKRVMRNHREAILGTVGNYKGLNVWPYDAIPRAINQSHLVQRIADRAASAWNEVVAAKSFRNAQATLLAPTGTISLVMDCDTSGIEPDFALVKDKVLAGGGSMKIVNQGIAPALRRLGYHTVQPILDLVEEGASLDLLPLEPEHRAVFATTAELEPMAHVLMVAAVQPFLSGAASKTINLPNSATVEDVSMVYREAHHLGLKAVALYRDGSKLTQPLTAAKPKPEAKAPVSSLSRDDALRRHAGPLEDWIAGLVKEPKPSRPPSLERGQREPLPSRRRGVNQKMRVDGQTFYLRTGEYPDGRLGEIFIDLANTGSTLDGFANSLAKMTSIALQYGVPVEDVVDALLGVKFEPAGMVELHERVKFAQSIPDVIARDLAIAYLGREDLAHTLRAVAIDSDAIVALDRRAVALDRRAVAVAEAEAKPTGETCRQSGCGGLLMQTGTCKTCTACGWNSGCG